MQKGDRYIIEIDEVLVDASGKQFAKIKGFNSLVFDSEGLDRLESTDVDRSFDVFSNGYYKGYAAGAQKAWSLAQRIAETPLNELRLLGLNHTRKLDDEFKSSLDLILSNTIAAVMRSFSIFDIHHK